MFVCDIQMPDIDGYALLQVIRERTSHGRFMPAVAVTAHATMADQARIRRTGYQEIVIKPYEFSALTKAVAEAVGLH